MSLYGNIFGKSERQVTDPHVREQEMIERIQTIDLNSQWCRLSAEKIRELNLAGVIQYACEELRYPEKFDADIRKLDNDLEMIVTSLSEAVRGGYELTAQWAGDALTFAIRNLKTDMSNLDEDAVEDTMKCRREYSENLRLLVELCKEHDNLTIGLKNRYQHRQEKRGELDEAKSRYLTRRDAGELTALLEELREHFHDIGSISDGAREVRDELNRLHMLKSALIGINIAIDVDQVKLNNCAAQIETRRNAMAVPPRARDPKFQARIDEADRIYRGQLQKDLDLAEEAIRGYARHIEGMTELAGQSVNLTLAARALETEKRLRLEQFDKMLEEQL